MVFEPLLSNGRQRVGAFYKRACRKSASKHAYAVECRNRLRVGVRARNAVACRGLRVGPSKHLKMGCRSQIHTQHADFAVKFTLDTSILAALSKGVPQGKRCLQSPRRQRGRQKGIGKEGTKNVKKKSDRPCEPFPDKLVRISGFSSLFSGSAVSLYTLQQIC